MRPLALILLCILPLGLGWAQGEPSEPPALRIEKLGRGGLAKPTGDHQHGVVSQGLGQPIPIRVVDALGRPVAGVRVHFQVIRAPEGAAGQAISPIAGITDSTGVTSARLRLGSVIGDYQVSASIRTSAPEAFVVFTAHARAQSWLLMLVVGLLGGLALFLMGMTLMSSGLRQSTGNRIRALLERLTQNRVYATLFGALITSVTQSSSATSVMLVGFVQSGLLRFRQTIGMIFGAAIGTTITVQLIAFRLADYSLLIIALGFALQLAGRRDSIRFAGDAVLGFGLLFFGMHIMSEAMGPLRTYLPFIDLLGRLEAPLLGILVGTLFTALIQSSSAFVGIIITLSMQGLISLEASIPLLLGANLGTTITGNIAALRASREAQKVAVAYTLFKLLGLIALVGFIGQFAALIRLITPEPIAQGAGLATENTPRLIANAHTIFNVIIAAAMLPFANAFARLVDWLLPARAKQAPEHSVQFLDPHLLDTPPVALRLARQEVVRLFGMVQGMVDDVLPPFVSRDGTTIAKLQRAEAYVDFLRDRINDYLLALTRRDITQGSIQEAFRIMYAAKELEQIADLVSSNLLERARYWLQSQLEFSPQGQEELRAFHQLTQRQLQRARDVLADPDMEKAKRLAAKYEAYKEFGRELERQHFARLTDDVSRTVSSSKTHLELVSMLRTIGSHSNNIAQVLMGWKAKG